MADELAAVPPDPTALDALAFMADRAVCDLVAAGNDAARAAVERRAAELQRDLLGDEASPIEAILARRVVLALLFAEFAQTRRAVAEKVMGDARDEGAAFVDRLIRRASQAEHDLERATRSLLTARRLLGPPRPLQINLAHQQVNLAEPGPIAGRVVPLPSRSPAPREGA